MSAESNKKILDDAGIHYRVVGKDVLEIELDALNPEQRAVLDAMVQAGSN